MPKTAFANQADALSVADDRRRESGTDLSVYQCDVCAAWHMGNRNGRDA
jgi:hypothetical protein